MTQQLVGCAWELCEDSLFVTYCDEAATPEKWHAYMKDLRALKGRAVRLLIYAEAVPPREVLTEIAGVARGEPWIVALISPSVAVRFAASTFAFVVKGFRFFPPDSVAAALAHLSADDAQRQRASRVLKRLRRAEPSHEG